MQGKFLENKGKHYLRVSTIVSCFRGGFGRIPEDVLQAKAKIGTEVHEICQKFLMGEETQATSPRAQNYVNSFKQFCKNGLLQKPLLCEERLFDDELGVTGQVDLVCPVKGSRTPILIDLKTSAKAEDELWLIQGALYAKMVTETFPEIQLSDTFIFLQLKEKGVAKAIRFENWRSKLPIVTSIVDEFMQLNKDKLQEMLKNEQQLHTSKTIN